MGERLYKWIKVLPRGSGLRTPGVLYCSHFLHFLSLAFLHDCKDWVFQGIRSQVGWDLILLQLIPVIQILTFQ